MKYFVDLHIWERPPDGTVLSRRDSREGPWIGGEGEDRRWGTGGTGFIW